MLGGRRGGEEWRPLGQEPFSLAVVFSPAMDQPPTPTAHQHNDVPKPSIGWRVCVKSTRAACACAGAPVAIAAVANADRESRASRAMAAKSFAWGDGRPTAALRLDSPACPPAIAIDIARVENHLLIVVLLFF